MRNITRRRRSWQKAHRRKYMREYLREYRQNNPDKVKEWRLNYCKKQIELVGKTEQVEERKEE